MWGWSLAGGAAWTTQEPSSFPWLWAQILVAITALPVMRLGVCEVSVHRCRLHVSGWKLLLLKQNKTKQKPVVVAGLIWQEGSINPVFVSLKLLQSGLQNRSPTASYTCMKQQCIKQPCIKAWCQKLCPCNCAMSWSWCECRAAVYWVEKKAT